MNTPRHGLLWMGAVVIAAGSWAGCARRRAHAEPEPPPLSAPPPPSRLLPPLEAGPIQAATPPPPAETAPPPAPARRRTESARPPDNARQEPKPTDVPKADVPAEGQRPPDETPRPAEPAAVLQLAPAAESDTSVVLMLIPGEPVFTPEVAGQLRELLSQGAVGALFLATDDVQAEYEALKARGVDLPEPTEQPWGVDTGFRDPSGNHIRLAQRVAIPA